MDLWPIRPLHNSLYWWRCVQRYWKRKCHLNIDINEKAQNSICSLELDISRCVLKYEIQGIPDLQPANLQFIHWMVSNVPGDKVQTKQINFFNDYLYFCHVPWRQRSWNWNQFLLYFFVFKGLRWRRELRVRSSFQFQTGLQQPVGKLNLIKIQSTFYNVFDGMQIWCDDVHFHQVEDGSPLHAILFLVYKQSGR